MVDAKRRWEWRAWGWVVTSRAFSAAFIMLDVSLSRIQARERESTKMNFLGRESDGGLGVLKSEVPPAKAREINIFSGISHRFWRHAVDPLSSWCKEKRVCSSFFP